MFVYITFLIRVHNPSKPIKIVSTSKFCISVELALFWQNVMIALNTML